MTEFYVQANGTFTAAGAQAFGFIGTVFRCIPTSSSDPLDASFSTVTGGRWSLPATYPVLHTFTSPQTAHQWLDARWSSIGLTPDDLPAEKLPDLAVMNVQFQSLADLATNSGLQWFGLPTTYPVGFETSSAYPVTRPIGARAYGLGHQGIVTRSASAQRWDGPMLTWSEIAIFPDLAPRPVLVDRLPYKRWTTHA
jgi:hypothetical protein